MPFLNNITESVFDTPLVKLNRIAKDVDATILIKMESHNPLGSVKDRIGLAMIEAAERDGILKPGESTIIEATSGNTGIALAFVAAAKGYRLILTMPENMSMERRRILVALGAELLPTPIERLMEGAVERAEQIHHETENSWMPEQFRNPANPDVHRRTTAEEIWRDTEGDVDMFVAGVGTGGTITGVADVLKERKPDFKAIAVEPARSPVISGGKPNHHKIQGIGAGFIPDILDISLIDETINVEEDDAADMTLRLSKEEGLFLGISAGCNVWAALEMAKRPENAGKTIVTVGCDTGERYLSTWMFEEEL
ncbi:MAG: cysteine synthase A [Verrucomicrobiota bacterium]